MNHKKTKALKIAGIIIILNLIFLQKILSQQKSDINFAVQYNQGFLIPHHKSINYLIKGFYKSAEFRIGFQTNGSKKWHIIHKFPNIGFIYRYSDFGNPKVLGNAHTFGAFINKNIYKAKKFELNFDFGFGFAFLNRPFNIKENIDNFIIGSHFNENPHLFLDFTFKINDKLKFKTGFGITHFSNGAAKEPNKGINLFSVYGSILFQKTHKQKAEINSFKDEIIKKNQLTLFVSSGWKELKPPWEKVYIISTVSLNAERQYSEKSRLGIGVDLFYDESETTENKNLKDNPKNKFFTGVFVSYDFLYGKTAFTIQSGFHPTRPTDSYYKIYQRYGFKYYINKHLALKLTLKSRLGMAQFIEWGVGYRF